MDKAEFIRVAPTDYRAAIATALRRSIGYFTIGLLRSSYVVAPSRYRGQARHLPDGQISKFLSSPFRKNIPVLF
jgi:hypothetical protein